MTLTDTNIRQAPPEPLPPIRGWWCWLATLVSGVLVGVTHPPINFGPVILIAFVPWLLALRGFRTAIGCGIASFLGGFIANMIPMSYLGDIVGYEGTESAMQGLWIASSAILATTFPIVAIPARWIMQRSDRRWWVLAIPLIWMAAEELRYYFPVASPLLYVGYALHQIDALIQIAEIGSVHLVSGFVLFVGATLTLALDEKLCGNSKAKRFAPIALTAGFVIVLGFGILRIQHFNEAIKVSGGPRIAVVQPNIPQELKNAGAPAPLWIKQDLLTREVAKEEPDMIIWSEAAFPYVVFPSGHLRDHNTKSRKEPSMLAKELDCSILAGAIIMPSEEEMQRPEIQIRSPKAQKKARYNAALHYDREGNLLSRHYKSQLVPGGEEIPYRHTLVGDMVSSYAKDMLSSFDTILVPGYRRELMRLKDKRDNEWRFSSKVCYEFAFPQLAVEIHNKAELPEDQRNVHFVATISNEGWYQGGAELDQAVILSRFRAIESRTTVVRATNDGVSAVIGPMGLVRKTLVDEHGVDRQVEGTMVADLPYLEQPMPTFYLKMGNTPYEVLRWLLLAFYCFLPVAAMRAKAAKRKAQRAGVDGLTRIIDEEDVTPDAEASDTPSEDKDL